MINCEKVWKGLECCADRTDRKCQICPYDSPDNIYCVSDITRDALKLLMEYRDSIISLQHTINELNKAIEERC